MEFDNSEELREVFDEETLDLSELALVERSNCPEYRRGIQDFLGTRDRVIQLQNEDLGTDPFESFKDFERQDTQRDLINDFHNVSTMPADTTYGLTDATRVSKTYA